MTANLPAILAQALQSLSAARVETCLVESLPPSLRQRLDSRLNADFERTGLKVIPGEKVSIEEIQAARGLIQEASKPLSVKRIAAEIARCLNGTKGRNADSADTQMLTDIFLEELVDKPGDAVIQALRDWVRESVWRPAPAEILAKVERLLCVRKSLARILDDLEREAKGEVKQLARQPHDKTPYSEWPAEQKARINDLLSTAFGEMGVGRKMQPEAKMQPPPEPGPEERAAALERLKKARALMGQTEGVSMSRRDGE
jgi:hypothetical protein